MRATVGPWWIAVPLSAVLSYACSMDFDAPFAGPHGPQDASVDGPADGAGGDAGAGTGSGGAKDGGGDGASKGGASGQGGTAGSGGSAGQGGTAGSGGSAGQGGIAASGGSAGQGGIAASGGSAGQGGIAGFGGSAGAAASGGATAGAAGSPCTALGHDEDGDGTDDACDNCPSVEDPTQANGDGDGIGDVCESPAGPGLYSERIYFEPFLTVGMPGWNVTGFVSGGDEAIGDASNCGAECHRDAVWTTAIGAPYAVESTFLLELSQNRWACVLFAMESDNLQAEWWDCCLGFSSGLTPGVSLWRHLSGAPSLNKVSETPDVEDAGTPASTWRRLRIDYRPGASIRCFFDNAAGDHAEVLASSANAMAVSYAGVRAYHSTVQFKSFVIYQ